MVLREHGEVPTGDFVGSSSSSRQSYYYLDRSVPSLGLLRSLADVSRDVQQSRA